MCWSCDRMPLGKENEKGDGARGFFWWGPFWGFRVLFLLNRGCHCFWGFFLFSNWRTVVFRLKESNDRVGDGFNRRSNGSCS